MIVLNECSTARAQRRPRMESRSSTMDVATTQGRAGGFRSLASSLGVLVVAGFHTGPGSPDLTAGSSASSPSSMA